MLRLPWDPSRDESFLEDEGGPLDAEQGGGMGMGQPALGAPPEATAPGALPPAPQGGANAY